MGRKRRRRNSDANTRTTTLAIVKTTAPQRAANDPLANRCIGYSVTGAAFGSTFSASVSSHSKSRRMKSFIAVHVECENDPQESRNSVTRIPAIWTQSRHTHTQMLYAPTLTFTTTILHGSNYHATFLDYGVID